MIKDYPSLFKQGSDYHSKAIKIANYTKDIADFLSELDLSIFISLNNKSVTFHSPCTLQHGQEQPYTVQKILKELEFQVYPVTDSHLCCGSNKLNHLLERDPDLIVTANIGCLMHLQKGTKTPVKHWIELL